MSSNIIFLLINVILYVHISIRISLSLSLSQIQIFVEIVTRHVTDRVNFILTYYLLFVVQIHYVDVYAK